MKLNILKVHLIFSTPIFSQQYQPIQITEQNLWIVFAAMAFVLVMLFVTAYYLK